MSYPTTAIHCTGSTNAKVATAPDPHITVDLSVPLISTYVGTGAQHVEVRATPGAGGATLFLSLDAARDLALQILELTEPADAPALSEVA